MSSATFESMLPTLDKLGVTLPDNIDVHAVAAEWFHTFSQYASASDVDGILSLFVDDGWWRDKLVFTWEFRTFQGAPAIRKFLQARAVNAQMSAFAFGDAALDRPFPDLVWIRVLFDFETDIGIANGVVRLVPQPTGGWKAHNICSNLAGLKAFPEKIGPLRNPFPNHGKWQDQRAREIEFVDADPKVLVVGSGQCGLEIAARLKHLDVPTLVVEKQERIGDQWRNRYDALCLHDPVWFDHMPYLPFPPSWPVYTPARKLANWLEFYAEAMELNVWTSSTVLRAEQHADNTWTVTVQRADGTERKLHVQHLVLALGWGGAAKWPDLKGKEEFKGQLMHSTMHKTGKNYVGKKVVIVGACTSAHDIASDCHEFGADTTMVQRDPTYIMNAKVALGTALRPLYMEGAMPVEIADRIDNSLPLPLKKCLWKRSTAHLAATVDKPLLDGLKKVGFKTWLGPEGLGFSYLAMSRAGGYYLDVGTSQLIADGKIKVKSDSKIAQLTPTGLKFENGSVLDADVVIFATGFEPPRTMIANICGEEIASRVGPIWDYNEEGELRNVWRWLGVPNLWYMIGNFAWARHHSKHLSLR
ncbi:FAD/NAD(P)-binding domain-containing protein, partial [Amylocystis lapponica]